MTDIEVRVESTMGARGGNAYVEREWTAEEIEQGKHRAYIGGHWDTHGKNQFDFLVASGLKPHHKFLDIGCGCFRAGRYLIDYLEPGNYYGIDSNRAIITAGYDHELSDEQRAKLPVENLLVNERFNTDFGVQFDMAIAQSVFTHVSLNHIRLCMFRVAKALKPGGKFFATFVERPPHTTLDKLREGPSTRFTERNPFWYYRADMQWAASATPLRFRYIGDWGHPTGQMMMELTRLTDEEAAAEKAKAKVAQQAAAKAVKQFEERQAAPAASAPAPSKPSAPALTPAQQRAAAAKKFVRRARGYLARRIAP